MGSKQTWQKNSKDMEVQAGRIKAENKMTHHASPGLYPSISAAPSGVTERQRRTFLPLNPPVPQSTNAFEMLINVLSLICKGIRGWKAAALSLKSSVCS